MTDASGTTSYDYDTRNRMTEKTTPIGTITYTHTNGLLTLISSNNVNGVSLTYGYDTQSRLQTVTDNKLNKTTNYDYWANGNLKTCTYPNQIQHNWVYNSRNRLTNLTIKNTTTNTIFKSFEYTVGVSGNRTKVVEDSGREINWTYDNLYRLTQENITNEPNSVNGVVDYTYDKVGNRQTRTSTLAGVSNQDFTGGYDDNDRLLAADYNYDSNGSTTQKPGGWAYTYDAENKLLTASQGTTTISYVYDGDGNRAIKTLSDGTNTVITRYLTDTQNPTGYAQVLEELNAGYAIQKRYTYGLDLISQTILNTDETSYYGYDGQGSARILTDSLGVLSDTYDYDAFGTLLARTGTTDNHYMFHGEQYDQDLGLYYLRARYMDGDIGRFVSMDEYEGKNDFPASLNKYLFTDNNSINRSDLSEYFTLADTMAANSIASCIRSAYVKVLAGSFFSGVLGGVDSSLQGKKFWDGFVQGSVVGLVANPIAALKLFGPVLRIVGAVSGIYYAKEAIEQENLKLAAYRTVLSVAAVWPYIAKHVIKPIAAYTNTSPHKLIPNPTDPFITNGPSNKALQDYHNHIKLYGSIPGRISVKQLPDGSYGIIDGHHRWQAAMDYGLKSVPIHIIE